ncbi:hypothetical protein [Hydrogenophaga luteola]|uniref:Uncharacterized protein n=1 Tax=Hydrogenophaga luteola TaxID=1591122 RepID=A0ABV7WAB2_9BURK
MAKTAKRLASIASGPWLTSVEDLVFYAIDKASPYNLALSRMSDSIAKIGKLTFAQLMIDKLGLSIMWTIINAGLPGLGGVAVAPAAASKCKTAEDVLKAAQASK